MKYPIKKSLQDTVELNPHIEEVHFTADGHHHFRAFKHDKDMYTRLREVNEVTKGGIVTNKMVLAPILNHRNEKHPAHLIVETVSRAEILKAKTVDDTDAKADILANLDSFTTEELQALLDAKKAAAKKK